MMTGFCPLESTCDAEPEMSVDKLSSSKSLNLIDEDPQFYGRPSTHIVSPQHHQRSPGRKCDKFTSARSILLDGEDMMMIAMTKLKRSPLPAATSINTAKAPTSSGQVPQNLLAHRPCVRVCHLGLYSAGFVSNESVGKVRVWKGMGILGTEGNLLTI